MEDYKFVTSFTHFSSKGNEASGDGLVEGKPGHTRAAGGFGLVLHSGGGEDSHQRLE